MEKISPKYFKLNSLVLDLESKLRRERPSTSVYSIHKDEAALFRKIKKEIKLLKEKELSNILKQWHPKIFLLRMGFIPIILGCIATMIIGQRIQTYVMGLGYNVNGLSYLINISYIFVAFRAEIWKANEMYVMQEFIREVQKYINPEFRKKCLVYLNGEWQIPKESTKRKSR